MKTQAKKEKLTFTKSSITELNDVKLYNIKGGAITNDSIPNTSKGVNTRKGSTRFC